MTPIERLVTLRRHRWAREILSLYGVEVPADVRIGVGLVLAHRCQGTVIHSAAVIGDRVMIYHQVTIGRADPWVSGGTMEAIHIGDDVILCAGAKVLGRHGILTVGRGSVIGANSVLTCSTGDWEIWAGCPAAKVGDRPRPHGPTTDMVRRSSSCPPGPPAIDST